jgi:hypothetical protein
MFKHIRHLVAFGAFALALVAAGYGLSQTPSLFLNSITGNEQITVVEPSTGLPVTSPQILTVTANTLRNTTGYSIVSTTTGTIVTTVATDNLLLTGAVTTATIDVPPSPSDGELFSINNATTSAFSGTITVASTDGSTFVPTSPTIVNLAATTSQEWQYTAASKIWYRVR